MSAYVKIFCHKHKVRSDGTSPVYYLVRMGGEEIRIAAKKYVIAKFFDNKAGVVKPGANNSIRLNTWLSSEKSKLEKIILDFENEGRPLSLELIKEEYLGGEDNKSFIQFCRDEIKNLKGIQASSTLQENGYCNNLEKFAPGVTFAQIDYKFLQNYQHYMANVLGKSKNGQFNDFKTLRKFFNIAVKKGKTKNYPFRNFSFSDEEVEKNFLTIEELQAMHAKVINRELPDKLFWTAGYFVLSCYTGIRRSDMFKFSKLKRQEFIQKNIVGNDLQLRMSKTKKITRIPLSTGAWEMINVLFDRPLKYSDSRCNEDLKDIMELLGVSKHITYHCSRHTFAILSLILGIRIEVVSDVLGHYSTR
jgi:site-specific recombinase XerD